MKPYPNLFFIDIDKSVENLLRDDSGQVITSDGNALIVSTHWAPYEYAPQSGILVGVPDSVFPTSNMRLKNHYDIKLKEGDKVHFHHFASHDDHAVYVDDKKIFMQGYEEIYAVERDGKTIPLEEYVFVEPDKETEEDVLRNGIMIRTIGEFKAFHGRIAFVNDRVSNDFGLNVGDHVLFESGAEYPMYIDGKILYRTRARKILCKITDKHQNN